MRTFVARSSKWIGLGVVTLGIATLAPTGIAHADTIDPPWEPAVAFNSWSGDQSNLTVSWTPVSGADGYEVATAPGDTPPSSPGLSTAAPGGDTSSAPVAVDYSGDDVSVSVWAYTGEPGNITALSTPASVTYAIPGAPTLTAAAVSGVRGEVKLSWAGPTFDGDTLVLRQGAGSSAGPTSGTAVPINAGDTSVTVSRLPDGTPANGTYFTLYEEGSGGADDWSYTDALGFAAPAPEGAMVQPNQSNDATQMHLTWEPPDCTPVVESQPCNHAILVENPGTKVANDPYDGKDETDLMGIPDGSGFDVNDVVAGDTYTFTVFNVDTSRAAGVAWSAPQSETLTDLATPLVTVAATPAFAAATYEGVTLKASVATIGTTPTGTITFTTGRHVLCTDAPITTDLTAQCQTSGAAVALDSVSTAQPITIEAIYSGDSKDTGSSDSIDLTITRVTPAVSIKTSKQKAKHVAIKSVIRGADGAGTGTVTMTSGHKKICVKKLSGGTASCTATAKKLGSGRHKVKVVYSGSKLYKTKSTSKTIRLKKS